MSLSFTVPTTDQQGTVAAPRLPVPQSISPGQDKITLIVDGAKVLASAFLSPALTGVVTSPDGNTNVTVTSAAAGTYYTYTIAIDTLPGQHRIGVEILSGTPTIILSEAQNVYTLAPGSNTAATLTLKGIMASAYIECANGPVDATNCAGSFVASAGVGSGGVYTLTAIAADYTGFPIASQPSIGFDNGGFTVVETDANNVVTLVGASTVFMLPGTQLTGPSGGFFVSASAQYGQSFEARCNKIGLATLGLANAYTGPTDPLIGETYTTFDPSGGPGVGTNYPGAGTLPTGSKTAGNPFYHGGNNPNAVTNLVSVSCDANLSLTIN